MTVAFIGGPEHGETLGVPAEALAELPALWPTITRERCFYVRWTYRLTEAGYYLTRATRLERL